MMANLVTVRGWTPRVHPDAWVAPTATLIGNVEVGAGANVWFGAVLRGDQALIRIGERASVQDNVVLHCNEDNDTVIGANVTLGHGAVLEGCTLDDFALVGMNACVLDGARVGEGALIAAGAVVKERDEIPAWTLAAGVPAVARKKLSGAALEHVRNAAAHYQELMALYEHLGRPVSAAGEDKS
jgi:carbonic anhydrase/acetyltransferase-like protein (isoleucine patch superfamily)